MPELGTSGSVGALGGNSQGDPAKGAGWITFEGHADLDPAHEALMLVEHYREAARLDIAKKHGTEFIGRLNQAEAEARELESALRGRNKEAAAKAFDRSAAICVTCHERFRDQPGSR